MNNQAPIARARPNRRSLARQVALQALYQWQMAGQDLGDIEAQFLGQGELPQSLEEEDRDADPGPFDVRLFRDLLHGVPAQLNRLDELLAPLLGRPINQLDPVERAVLRIGVYELREHLDVPYRVIIDEAVELAKRFGAEQGHRYVNGVLDKLAQSLRPLECVPRRPPRRPAPG